MLSSEEQWLQGRTCQDQRTRLYYIRRTAVNKILIAAENVLQGD
jgi:hypothetical protein